MLLLVVSERLEVEDPVRRARGRTMASFGLDEFPSWTILTTGSFAFPSFLRLPSLLSLLLLFSFPFGCSLPALLLLPFLLCPGRAG